MTRSLKGEQDDEQRETGCLHTCTNKIIGDLEQGVRTWMKPWNAGHTAGRITRPLRHNGVPYSGINIWMLWAEAMDKGFTAPMWMTFKQS
jgi:antirestriction protein ArdC